jgi:hypothetical protein
MRSPPLPLIALCAFAACSSKRAEQAAAEAALPPLIALESADAGLTPEPVDLNGDGKPEILQFRATTGIVRRAVDLNGDGRFDLTSFYDPSGGLVREEHDGDFDGRVDWVDVYEAGQRVRADADTDYDGRVDVVFRYQGGSLLSKERL